MNNKERDQISNSKGVLVIQVRDDVINEIGKDHRNTSKNSRDNRGKNIKKIIY